MSSSDSSYNTQIGVHSAEEYEDGEDVIDCGLADDSDTDEAGPDRFDPVTENSFTERYERDVTEKRNVERGLSRRFHGSEPLSSCEVIEEAGQIQCVTEPPGFAPICLNKFTVRLSAAKYKNREGRRYTRTGFENQ
eukprot:gene13410-biopygen10716